MEREVSPSLMIASFPYVGAIGCPAQPYSMVGDGLGDVFQIQAQFLGLNHELIQFSAQQAPAFGSGWCGRDGTYAGQDFQHAFGQQLRDDFVRRVGVNFEAPGSRPAPKGRRRRAAFGRRSPKELARNDCSARLLGGIGHLLVIEMPG